MKPSINFDYTSNMAQSDGRASDSFPLARQPSIYAMTFDELQTTGGLGKDFGSMNMEDLLKSVWAAEGAEAYVAAAGGTRNNAPCGTLERQGSLTLPRTLSQRTVDEVWKDLFKENGIPKDGNGSGFSNLYEREPTLGEVTLEQFLTKAGVVREDVQPIDNSSTAGFCGGSFSTSGNTNKFTFGFQQPVQNEGMLGDHTVGISSFSGSSSLALNGNLVRSFQEQQHQQSQPQMPPLFPKQAHMGFTPPQSGNNAQMIGNSTLLASSGGLNSVVGMPSASLDSTTEITQNGLMGVAGLRAVTTTVAGGSPGDNLHQPDAISKSSLDTSSLSPSPYAFNEGGRGRRSSGTLEKQVERRRKRMIKNRESAARSRARKQAYTLELEAEVAKLKEVNNELQKKQAEIMELQKKQTMDTLRRPRGAPNISLRRTMTGPW